jgi:hypothetical protein
MFRLRLMTAAAVGILLFVPLVPAAANAAGSGRAADARITVQHLNSSGSGCPSGTATAVATGSEAFTLVFDAYEVRGGSSKNCNSLVRVTAPPGWTYGVVNVYSYGWAQLTAAGTGRFGLLARFTGFPFSFTDRMTVPGPYNDFWTRNNWGGAIVWAPCGSTHDYDLTLNSTISVTGPQATNSMTYHGEEVSVFFQLKLMQCP